MCQSVFSVKAKDVIYISKIKGGEEERERSHAAFVFLTKVTPFC